jgi:hypothetical protein
MLADTGSSVAYTWGSTRAERDAPFPCDRTLANADESLFRAVSVRAPARRVFRWLCQLKVAPYSYDWIDNFGRRSPSKLTPGAEVLEVGQSVMTFFEITDFETDRHLTLRTSTSRPGMLFDELAASYVVLPQGESESRLIVKLLARYPRGPIGWCLRRFLPWADLVMMRKQLLTLKALAEAQGTG